MIHAILMRSLFCLVFFASVSAEAASNPWFLDCSNTEYKMRLMMSFDDAARMFTYVLSEDGLPRGFHANPEGGFGREHSWIKVEAKPDERLEISAQIQGGNVVTPEFLYSAEVKLKSTGSPGEFKLENIEVLNHGVSQRLIWLNGAICKVHQGV